MPAVRVSRVSQRTLRLTCKCPCITNARAPDDRARAPVAPDPRTLEPDPCHPRAARSLALLALSAAVLACQGGTGAAPSGDRVAVSVSESGCSPSTVTVPSGPVTFVVTNAGTETGEFEIVLADTRVIDEVENIVPGLRREHVDAGGWRHLPDDLRQHPGAQGRAHGDRRRGAVAAAERGRRPGEARRRARRLRHLRQRAGRPTSSRRSGRSLPRSRKATSGAKALYAPARIPWERIEPIAELFPDLDQAIDFREEDFDGGVEDPGFKGFHKIEKVLFKDGTTDGLAPLAAELAPTSTSSRSGSTPWSSTRGSWPGARAS